DREERVSAGVHADGDHDVAEHLGRSLDEVRVTEGHGVEAARVDGELVLGRAHGWAPFGGADGEVAAPGGGAGGAEGADAGGGGGADMACIMRGSGSIQKKRPPSPNVTRNTERRPAPRMPPMSRSTFARTSPIGAPSTAGTFGRSNAPILNEGNVP